jgi:hypothetical protein
MMNNKFLYLLIFLLSVIFFTGCSGDDDPNPEPTPPPTPSVNEAKEVMENCGVPPV